MRWYKCEGFTTYGIEYSKEGSVEKSNTVLME